ncbi:hypothetical protein [Haladaptatus sp. DJG-WS-42]|uniref:hypothetical protein n=1 Tax=Haladaptatus sp. DJG-WS-42 TaxID=3120516 RepID=UPI0030D1CB38
MVISPESLADEFATIFEDNYDDVVIYGDEEKSTILHEGPARIRANGWVEVPSGRLLSPNAVHHIDVQGTR